MDNLPYSYHTFIFPFVWKTNSRMEISEFEAILEKDYWISCDWEKHAIKGDISMDDALSDYASFQYFNNSICDVVYGITDKQNYIIKNYSFMPKKLRNKALYIIKKGTDIFKLVINEIKISIYNTGVATISYETEYFPEDENMKIIENILKINNFGRRICHPFFSKNVNVFTLNADYLGIEFFDDNNQKVLIEDNFKKYCSELLVDSNVFSKKVKLTYIPNIVKGLIAYKSIKRISSIEGMPSDKNVITIQPVIDDRMFVCCLIRDKEYMVEIKKSNGSSEDFKYLYEKDIFKVPKLELQHHVCKLYSLIFVDEGDPTCQDRNMFLKLLNKHLYTRWIEYGTIHGITQNSFMCITGEGIDLKESVINPFLTMYVKMATLSLAQRASIISFQKQAESISRGVEKRGIIKSRKVNLILELQERYVAFKNQLLFYEVTSQEQGIELYSKLREFLFIKEQSEQLESQISSLNNIANYHQNLKTNIFVLMLTIVTIIIPLLAIIIEALRADGEYSSFLGRSDSFRGWDFFYSEPLFTVIIVGVILSMVFLIIMYILHNKKST